MPWMWWKLSISNPLDSARRQRNNICHDYPDTDNILATQEATEAMKAITTVGRGIQTLQANIFLKASKMGRTWDEATVQLTGYMNAQLRNQRPGPVFGAVVIGSWIRF